jgi:hypothetical protein
VAWSWTDVPSAMDGFDGVMEIETRVAEVIVIVVEAVEVP